MADGEEICIQTDDNNTDYSASFMVNDVIGSVDQVFIDSVAMDISSFKLKDAMHAKETPSVSPSAAIVFSETLVGDHKQVEHVHCHVASETNSHAIITSRDGGDGEDKFQEPSPKRLKLHIPQIHLHSNGSNSYIAHSPPSTENPSPEGKRRRIQHDYRRLSSSGYVDDYENGKDKRFTSPTEADILPISPGRSKSVSPRTKSPVNVSKLSPQPVDQPGKDIYTYI